MQSISGPTLTILSRHVCEDPTVVGWIFTGRSIGFIIGSIFPSWLEKCKINQMLPLSLSVLSQGSQSHFFYSSPKRNPHAVGIWNFKRCHLNNYNFRLLDFFTNICYYLIGRSWKMNFRKFLLTFYNDLIYRDDSNVWSKKEIKIKA